MPQFYVVDDLRRDKQNIAHFDKLREAVRAYKDLPGAYWKALGAQDGGDATDLIRCVPVLPGDLLGEDVMALEILEHPMWKSRPELLVTAQDLASLFLVRYCLFRGCLLPIPTRDSLPMRLRGKRLWPSSSQSLKDGFAGIPEKYGTAIAWIEVAGVGTLSLAEFKRRYRADSAFQPFPLILRLSAHGQNKNGSYYPLNLNPWEFHLLVRRSEERLNQNKTNGGTTHET